MLWIPFTLIAAAAQTARNAMQSGLTASLGTLGATQVRFLYGFPFALVFLAAAAVFEGMDAPAATPRFLAFTAGGAVVQVLATALSKTEAVQIAVFGLLILGEHLTVLRAAAIVIATIGVALTALKPGERWTAETLRPALLGIASGGCFALAAVGFRGGVLALPEGGYWLRAATTLAWSLGLQALILGLWMLAFAREALLGSFRLWRQSVLAGFLGALASQFWFLGFSLTAAANVRTLGLVEVLFANAVGWRVFRQKPSQRQLVGMILIVLGVGLLLVAV
jgi:drug/metabolite transporter (DMT)-like permease